MSNSETGAHQTNSPEVAGDPPGAVGAILTSEQREALSAAIKDSFYEARDHGRTMHQAAEDERIVSAVEAILRARLASLQESNVALLQRVADLTAERDEARAEAEWHRDQADHHIGRANRGDQQVGHLSRVVRGLEESLNEAESEIKQRRRSLAKFVDAHAVWVERNAAATARAENAERALAARDEVIARVRVVLVTKQVEVIGVDALRHEVVPVVDVLAALAVPDPQLDDITCPAGHIEHGACACPTPPTTDAEEATDHG